jgi:hypothetical membrane protein
MFIHEGFDWMKKIDFKKLSGLIGILAPIAAWISITVAIIMSPWFSFTENYLSDLGGSPDSDRLWDTHGYASLIFNFGLVAAGILGLVFSVGIRRYKMFRTPPGNIGTVIMMLVSIALVGIGLFSETTGVIHTFFSVVFFVLVGVALLFLGIDQLRSKEGLTSWLVTSLFVFGLLSIPLFVLPKPLGSNAVAELIPIISISIFSIFYGNRLYKLPSPE